MWCEIRTHMTKHSYETHHKTWEAIRFDIISVMPYLSLSHCVLPWIRYTSIIKEAENINVCSSHVSLYICVNYSFQELYIVHLFQEGQVLECSLINRVCEANVSKVNNCSMII